MLTKYLHFLHLGADWLLSILVAQKALKDTSLKLCSVKIMYAVKSILKVSASDLLSFRQKLLQGFIFFSHHEVTSTQCYKNSHGNYIRVDDTKLLLADWILIKYTLLFSDTVAGCTVGKYSNTASRIYLKMLLGLHKNILKC